MLFYFVSIAWGALQEASSLYIFALRQGHSFNSYCNLRSVAIVGGDGSNFVNNLHAGYNLTEGCVLSVQMRSVCVHNEEL